MTFTYNGDLATDLDRIRFAIDDTVDGTGIKPNGDNFTDEELEGLLADEGTVGRTVAAVFEKLAGSYARLVDTKIGPRDEKSSQTAQMYASLAAQKRKEHGYATGNNVITVGAFDEGLSEDEPD